MRWLHTCTFLFILFFINLYRSYAQIDTIAFERFESNLVFVSAKIVGTNQMLTFLFDTGSSGSSLDSSSASALGITANGHMWVTEGIGGKRSTPSISNQTLLLHHTNFTNLQFFLSDYSLLTQYLGFKIDGVLGNDIWDKYKLYADYEQQTLTLFENEYIIKPKRKSYKAPFLYKKVPVSTAKVSGKNATGMDSLFFDSGASASLLLSHAAINKHILDKRKKLPISVTGHNGKAVLHYTSIPTIKFGKYTFKNVPAYIVPDSIHIFQYPNRSGLLGNELLHRFNTYFDYKNQVAFFTPNKFLNAPFDCAYTGMELYEVEGNIVVNDVMPNSPAAKIGMLNGDVVFSIDKHIGASLQTFRSALQQVDKKIEIIIVRNQTFYQTIIEPVNICKKLKGKNK